MRIVLLSVVKCDHPSARFSVYISILLNRVARGYALDGDDCLSLRRSRMMAKSERRSMTFVTFAGNCDYRFWHMAEMRWRWYCEYDGFEGHCLAAKCPRWRRLPIAEEETR